MDEKDQIDYAVLKDGPRVKITKATLYAGESALRESIYYEDDVLPLGFWDSELEAIIVAALNEAEIVRQPVS